MHRTLCNQHDTRLLSVNSYIPDKTKALANISVCLTYYTGNFFFSVLTNCAMLYFYHPEFTGSL